MKDTRYQVLLDAVTNGDFTTVKQLVGDEKIDWRAHDEEAVYLAAKYGHRNILNYLASTVIEEYADRVVRAKAGQHTDVLMDEDLEDMIALMKHHHIQTAKVALDSAVDAMAEGALLSIAMKYPLPGLFRYIRDHHPDALTTAGPYIAIAEGLYEMVKPLVEAGVGIHIAQGRLLTEAVAQGDAKAVRYMIEAGVNVNVCDTIHSSDMHPLMALKIMANREKHDEIEKMLFDAGADIRSDKCAAIKTMVYNKDPAVFDFVEHADPASDLALLAGLESDIRFQGGAPSTFLKDRFPWIEKWDRRDLLRGLYDTLGDTSGEWYRKMLSIHDLDEDDGLLLKLAICGINAQEMGGYILSRGANPNTRDDLPLKLAVLFEKPEMIMPLVEHGGDPFAQGGVVFREAHRLANPDIDKALKDAVLYQQNRACDLIRKDFPGGLSPAVLRTAKGVLMLAARAGLFPALAGAGHLYQIDPALLLEKDENGASVAGILAARGEHQSLFSKKIWGTDIEKPAMIFDALFPHDRKVAAPLLEELKKHHYSDKNQRQIAKSISKKFKL